MLEYNICADEFVVGLNFINNFDFFRLFLGPRTKKPKKPPSEKGSASNSASEDKRPRTAFSGPQLARLKVRIIDISKILQSH